MCSRFVKRANISKITILWIVMCLFFVMCTFLFCICWALGLGQLTVVVM